MNVFRCGYCGTPTDKDGNSLSIEDCNKLSEKELKKAKLIHGYCCYEELQDDSYIVVTKDMAIDAQDPFLEGEIWKW